MHQATPTADSPRFGSLLICGLAALGLALGVAVWLTRSSFDAFASNQLLSALKVVLADAPLVLGWLLAAWGFGSLIGRALHSGESTQTPMHIEFGAGVAAMLWLDHALGAAGLLAAGGGVGAWALLAVGWGLALEAARRRFQSRSTPVAGDFSPLILLAAVPGATLMIIASTSAPGWLWSSEAHGYDVLEYHLQLPREWLAAGSLTPLTHNVYSFAPSYVEAAYYHLAILLDPFATRPADGAIQAATACQLLHAALMIWAASEVSLLASRFVSRWAALAAGAIAISVPWVIITGSMAYNEAVLIGTLALCWRLIDARQTATRMLVLIGFLAGVACGAKLTALGGVALPIGALLLTRIPAAQWWRTILACTLGGLIALGPYLIRNFAAIEGGNPFFPLFMNALGHAHWTSEQAQRWNAAHAADEPWLDRLGALWTMGFAHAQWAGLWFLALFAALPAWRNRSQRRVAFEALLILALQLGFWLALTHLQSRFLLPCLPPLVILIVLALRSMATRARRAAMALGVLIPLALGLWGTHLYAGERGGRPATYIDGLALRTGVSAAGLDRAFAQELAAANSDVYLTLFSDPRRGVYLLGDATPFYILRPVLWHTTWDTSPLGEIIRMHGDDQRAWAAALIERGLPLVLVNEAEMHRLAVIDGWYDPDVAAADWRGFFESHARPAAIWPIGTEHRRVLYEIIPPR